MNISINKLNKLRRVQKYQKTEQLILQLTEWPSKFKTLFKIFLVGAESSTIKNRKQDLGHEFSSFGATEDVGEGILSWKNGN